jgi:hypothetical protein
MAIEQTFARDGNGVPITGLGLVATKAITYSALTTGATGATTLFTVTGPVAVRVWAVVSGTDLTGSGTLEAGISGNTASLLAQVAATALDVGEIWVDSGPATVEALPALQILNGTNIIQTIATDTVTAGTLTYYCAWFPLSNAASVT